MRLTGRTRIRVGWRGRLVMQVEEHGTVYSCIGGTIDGDEVIRWRDARVEDLTAGEWVGVVCEGAGR